MVGVSFVIFNYDRCIEQFLLNWAQDALSQSEVGAAKLVMQIPVLHAFGQTGQLPLLQQGARVEIGFGDQSARMTWQAAQQ